MLSSRTFYEHVGIRREDGREYCVYAYALKRVQSAVWRQRHIPNSEEESADRKADGPGSIALLQGFCQISKSREILATDTEILAKTLSYVLLSKVRLRATSTRPHDRDSGLSRIPRIPKQNLRSGTKATTRWTARVKQRCPF